MVSRKKVISNRKQLLDAYRSKKTEKHEDVIPATRQ